MKNIKMITWENVMPIYIQALQSKNTERIALAREELMRLAKMVDEINGKELVDDEKENGK